MGSEVRENIKNTKNYSRKKFSCEKDICAWRKRYQLRKNTILDSLQGGRRLLSEVRWGESGERLQVQRSWVEDDDYDQGYDDDDGVGAGLVNKTN